MATTIHAFSPEEIMAYLDGELASERALDVSQHLEECRDCQLLIADFEALSNQLASWEVAAGSSLPPEESSGSLAPPTKPFWKKTWLITSLAASILVGLGFYAHFQRPRSFAAESVGLVNLQEAKQQKFGFFDRTVSSRSSRNSTSVMPRTEAIPRVDAVMPDSGPSIVRTAQLSLISKDFDGIRAQVERLTAAHQGYIGQLQLNMSSGSARSLNATLKVPANQLDSAIREIKQLGRISSESQTGEDVTQRAVDLQARLSNLETTETRLQQMLRDRTGKLSEVLEVEEAVDRTRGEIETMEAEQKMLSNQISLASVQLSVSEEFKAALQGTDESLLTRLRNSAVEGYQNAVEMVMDILVFFISIGPSLLIIAAFLFPGVWLLRKWRARSL